MIKDFGRHSYKQFVRGQPIRFGYKALFLCITSGYFVKFSFYQGKSPNANAAYEEQFGKTTAPFIQMIDNLTLEVKQLALNFSFDLFTGFAVPSFLTDEDYGGTGTIIENRVP
ncbi:piggyBac transposable element-derived protein 3-like [Schistocerca piceifrons]|uniref:piggyBac transposable element-derived protein 3-like n=1 Tax=Schistocerca piceifrons TaxID=274613 RepID=UPI001F5F682C|nr:piggyBac transposable element-derived protein 3-like [Schistocerca piceifrons]